MAGSRERSPTAPHDVSECERAHAYAFEACHGYAEEPSEASMLHQVAQGDHAGKGEHQISQHQARVDHGNCTVVGEQCAEDVTRRCDLLDLSVVHGDDVRIKWEELCLEADEIFLRLDYEALVAVSRAMTEIRPDHPRGWLLHHLALRQLEASQAALLSLLQAGLASCERSGRCQMLKDLLDNEFCMQDVKCVQMAQAAIDALLVSVFRGEWDTEGVYLYQAFNDDIADWALLHQQLGGPHFNTRRTTWIKPSFGWVLYRSGYGCKPNQNRVLKIKVSHAALGNILSQCKYQETNKTAKSEHSSAQDGSNGRVQWDPERDMMSADGREPRALLRQRAIQIGVAGKLSELYVQSALWIQDVTALAHKVCQAHRSKKKGAMDELRPELPVERPYMPQCHEGCLIRLGMMPGETASALQRLGRGKAR